MTANRIDEILQEVRSEIIALRASGGFPEGYENAVEENHNRELGKVLSPDGVLLSRIEDTVRDLESKCAELSVIEPDSAGFRPWRFVRELAMSRHQLIRMRNEVSDVLRTASEVIALVVSLHGSRPTPGEEAVDELIMTLYSRSLVIEKLVVVCTEMEERVRRLEPG